MATSILKLIELPNGKVEHSLTEKLVGTLLEIIFVWVPNGSPGYRRKINEVAYWLIEVDEGTRCAEREIAFDTLGGPILYAPTNRNFGLWTDSERTFAEGEYEVRTAQEFNQFWAELEKQKGA